MALPSVAALSSSIKPATVKEGLLVRVKQEQPDEAEIRELAAKMVEANKQKMANMPQSAAARNSGTAAMATGGGVQPGQTSILGFFNRSGGAKGAATPANAAANIPALSPDSEKKREKQAMDEHSQKGKFGWVTLGKTHIPYIIRTPDEKYCAVRIVETKLLSKYMNYLHADIYSCTCIRSYYITEAEARLFNEINLKHCELQFGREAFTVKDLVVKLQDASEFYNFLDVCYNKLIHCGNDAKDKCGFIRINGESVVPYTVREGNKYVPLFYFEGETDNLKLKAEKLENWDLAYLKFCCKVQGIRNELFASETCSVISLGDIKSYFPSGTLFEDYWPNKLMESQLLVSQKGAAQTGLTGSWIKAPPGATPPTTAASATTIVVNKVIPSLPQNTRTVAPQMQPAPQPVVQPAPLTNGWPGLVGGQPTYQPATVRMGQAPISMHNQMSQPATNRSAYQLRTGLPQQQPAAPQYYPSPHAMSQAAQMVPQPPPLVRVAGPPPTLGNTGSYTTAGMGNSTSSMHLMGLSDGRSGTMMPPPPHLQYPSHNVPATPVSTAAGQHAVKYPPPLIPVNGSNPSRYHHPYQPGAEVIDLSSPPQSPQTQQQRQQQQQQQVMGNGKSSQQPPPPAHDPNGIWKKLIPIMEAPQTPGSHQPFKIQKALVNEKMVPCINAKPYINSELLMTIPDLVSHFFPSVDLDKCRQVLQDVLKVNLYRGNSQQMQVLREGQKCKSLNEIVPLIQLRDVVQYMPQLRYMFERTHGSGNEPASKRQRTS